MKQSHKRNQAQKTTQIIQTMEKPDTSGNKIAKIVQADNPATIMVQWGNNPPQTARYLDTVDVKKIIGKESIGREVVISLIDNDPTQPMIMGVVANPIEEMVNMEITPENTETSQSKSPAEIVRDDENITITAKNQITLKCGQGSITIQKDGKIVVKGTNLISRSSGLNRIKGGSVGIN